MAKCLSETDGDKCQGFTDEWSQSREEHFTSTVHDEDCPKHPENLYADMADEMRDRQRDDDLDWDAMESSDADPGL